MHMFHDVTIIVAFTHYRDSDEKLLLNCFYIIHSLFY